MRVGGVRGGSGRERGLVRVWEGEREREVWLGSGRERERGLVRVWEGEREDWLGDGRGRARCGWGVVGRERVRRFGALMASERCVDLQSACVFFLFIGTGC